jgi:hypothetical protein
MWHDVRGAAFVLDRLEPGFGEEEMDYCLSRQ